MINLFFTLIFTEIAIITILSFKNPFKKLAISCLDRVKLGQGPVLVKTIAGTMLVVFMSSLCGTIVINKRSRKNGGTTPTDQILLGKYLLQTSLVGFSVFLAVMIEWLHHYTKELHLLRKNKDIKALENEITRLKEKVKQDEVFLLDLKLKIKQLESECERKAKQVKNAEASELALRKQSELILVDLKAKIKHLESEFERKAKEAKVAEANALALKKQSEGFLFEYDRLLEDNHSLRNQLQSIDERFSGSDRKNM